jgi:hypothetical protein
MPDRHSDRERWETYLLIILLATRPYQFLGGVVLLIYALAALFFYPVVSLVSLLLAGCLLLIVYSDRAAQYAAQAGAWLATLGMR